MFFVIRYNSNAKEKTSDMPVIRAGDVVLEVNGVVVSPNSIDKVRMM